MIKKQPTIVLYSGPKCKYCKLAKEYFDREGLEYTEWDVTKVPAAKEKLFNYGTRSVPVIVINDEPIVGFDEPFIAAKIKSYE